MKIFFSVFLMFSLLVYSVFGQPIVQPCYLIPTDMGRDVYHHEVEKIRSSLTEIQDFYASEMKRRGYGEKTFQFSTKIPIYLGHQKLSFYKDVAAVRNMALHRQHGDNILLVFLVGAESIQGGNQGVYSGDCGEDRCPVPGLVVIPLEGRPEYQSLVIAHELGHAFGFDRHQENQKNYVMQAAIAVDPNNSTADQYSFDKYRFHPDTAKVLNQSYALSLREGSDLVEDNRKSEVAADVNNDGYVDLSDVLIVRSGMQNSTSYDTDLNDDGITDEIDLAIVKLAAIDSIAAAAPSSGRLRNRKVKIITWGAIKRN